MKILNLTLLISVFALLVSCGNQSNEDQNISDAESAGEGIHFGEVISEEGAVSFEELMAAMEDKESIEDVKVIATVGSVCQTKGCWMNISGSGEDEIFVQFKDYGFFMPKDLTDSKVALQGKAYFDITTVDDLKHFAEDEGLSQEEIDAITEPKKELKFMAAGVKVLDRSVSEELNEADTEM